MLTRLRVNGFKNLVDVDVRFGPFTCIAGANGVGKSNLFDAIRFLSALADRPLIDAALSVRDEGGGSADVRSLFHRTGDQNLNQMSFEVEMIVAPEGVDDLGQIAKASTTFLRYSLTLAYRDDDSLRPSGSLEITREELVHIKPGSVSKHLAFNYSPEWLKSAVQSRKKDAPFISTKTEGESHSILLHQDTKGGGGRPYPRLAASLPRTVLSVVNAAESPTALLARREMQSWRLLQLEPASMRKPDEFTSLSLPGTKRLGEDGSHLAAALYHVARTHSSTPTHSTGGNGQVASRQKSTEDGAAQIYAEVANRLSELIDDVREVWIDRDEQRELLNLHIRDRNKTSFPARALSDGTLRFLALSVLALSPESQGLLCMEEPENGIHPARIPAMLRLLKDIVTDVDEPVGPDNPLQQVIINTHSPSVVQQIPDDSLLMAQPVETMREGRRFKRVSFHWLPDTWRAKEALPPGISQIISRGQILDYLNPVSNEPDEPEEDEGAEDSAGALPSDPYTPSRLQKRLRARSMRVIDRLDIKQLLIPFDWVEAGKSEL